MIDVDVHTNGHLGPGASPPALGPRLPRREAWIDLPEEYPEFRVRAWVNYPQRLDRELKSKDQARITAALRQIVLEHNGWIDDEGNAFPPASDPAFWDEIPTELAIVVIALVNLESGKLARLQQTRSGR